MLEQKLEQLFRAMAGGPAQPPVPDRVIIAEVGPDDVDAQGRSVVLVVNLRSPQEYQSRFSELMAQGFSWLNMNYSGLLDGKALVIVEVPRHRSTGSGVETSVNLSGPPSYAAASGWDARSHVVVK